MTVDIEELTRHCAQALNENEKDYAVERGAKMNQSVATILRVAPAISITALVLCLATMVLIVYALMNRRIPSRKYIVILSRTIADIFSCILITLCSFLSTKASASHTVLILFLFISTFSFMNLAMSHIGVVLLRHISITRPYGFQSICTVLRVSILVAIGWLICLLYGAAYAPFYAVILNPEKEDVCTFSGCQLPLLAVCIAIVSFLLPTVALIYGCVVYKMRQISVSEKRHNEPEVTKKKLWKFLGFGGHIALFLLIGALVIVGSAFIVSNAQMYNGIRRMMNQDCDVVEYIDTVIRLEMLAGGAIVLWVVRVIFDLVVMMLCEYRKLLPWMAMNNLEPLRENTIASRASTLQWQRNCLNYPVFNIENHLHPWDFKN